MEDNTRSTTVHDLPDEILIKIFSHFSFNELLDVIQNVCDHWRKLTHDSQLWLDKVYIIRGRARNGRSCCGVICTECIHCRCEKYDKEVVQTIRKTPQLRTVLMMRGTKNYIIRMLSRNCRNLTTFQLHGCQKMSYKLFKEIFDNCSKIQTLIIKNGLLTEERYVKILSDLKHLHSLELFSCGSLSAPVQLRLLADICPQIKKIDFQWDYYPLEDLEYFLNVKRYSLSSLTLRWTMAGKRCVVPLLVVCAQSLKQLKLYLYDVLPEEEPEVFTALGQLHSLKELTAHQVQTHQLGVICHSFQHGCLPKLRKLHLQYDHCLNNAAILTISENCPDLQELRINCSSALTDEGLRNLHCLQHLEILELSSCNGFGGAAIVHIAKLPAVHTLVLQNMADLGQLQPGLEHIVEMKKLRSLDLFYSSNLKAVPFDKFPGRLVNLRQLYASCSESPNLFDNLCHQMPQLRICDTLPWTEDDWMTDFETDEESDDQNMILHGF